ncbi:MAG: hypothetical protein AB7S97_00760 [Thermoplasmata archaeon]
MKAKQLVSLSVITSDAQKLGQVMATDVDTETWKVTHLHIGLTDDSIRALSYKKPLLGGVSVCLPVTYVNGVKDVVTLKTSITDLKNAPECKEK